MAWNRGMWALNVYKRLWLCKTNSLMIIKTQDCIAIENIPSKALLFLDIPTATMLQVWLKIWLSGVRIVSSWKISKQRLIQEGVQLIRKNWINIWSTGRIVVRILIYLLQWRSIALDLVSSLWWHINIISMAGPFVTMASKKIIGRYNKKQKKTS